MNMLSLRSCRRSAASYIDGAVPTTSFADPGELGTVLSRRSDPPQPNPGIPEHGVLSPAKS